jgi:hypothetical protein
MMLEPSKRAERYGGGLPGPVADVSPKEPSRRRVAGAPRAGLPSDGHRAASRGARTQRFVHTAPTPQFSRVEVIPATLVVRVCPGEERVYQTYF